MENCTIFKNTPAEFQMIAVAGCLEGPPFTLGEGEEAHDARLSDFMLGAHSVTQAVWEWVMRDNPAHFKSPDRPVEQVSWLDITKKFLPKLNDLTRSDRSAGSVFRLPTKAEWEYAARGGKNWRDFPFEFSGSDKVKEVAWYEDNSHGSTQPVGLKTPNLLGLYDMSGNVWEWCEDWYDDKFYAECRKKGVVQDPCNREKGVDRVLRGGSWLRRSQYCRPGFRSRGEPSRGGHFVGFRLSLVFPSVQ